MTTQNGRAFNEWLRAQLKAKKMSQRQLAQQSGVDHSTISRLIRGDRMPSLGTATKLARGLRELRDDADTPQYLGLVASGSMNPTARVEYALRADDLSQRAAGPPDHGVLPGGADAPLRSTVPGFRAERPERAIGRPLHAGPLGHPGTPDGRQRGFQPGGRRYRIRPARLPHPRPRAGASRALLAHFQGTARISLLIRAFGDSERRRLGRRRSHIRDTTRLTVRPSAWALA